MSHGYSELIRQYFTDHFPAITMTYRYHVSMQEDSIRRTKMLSIDRVHSFIVNVLAGKFWMTDESTDLLMDGAAESFLIYLRVYLFDYLDRTL